MLRRLSFVLLALALIVGPFPFSSAPHAFAQNGSPVAAEPIPTETPLSLEQVAPAEAGNTQPGFYSSLPIAPRNDVYFFVYEITVGGQTDVIDGTNGTGIFDAAGYRTDNAKVVTIVTTAVHYGNFRLCILFDAGMFTNPSAAQLLRKDGASWVVITDVPDGSTPCGYSDALGTFAVAEPGATPSLTASSTGTSVPSTTATPTSTPSSTSTESPTSSATPSTTATATETATSASGPIQFALPNVYVTFAQIPSSGNTTGAVLSSGDVPGLPNTYLTSNAWFFFVESTVNQPGNKQLCVNFETTPYADPHRLVLLQRNGTGWSVLTGQTLVSLSAEQGTHCAYIGSFGDFALVERTPATATATATPTRTLSPTSTATGTRTATSTPTTTPSASTIPSSTPSSTATVSPTSTSSHTATATSTATSTPTATLAPGSFPNGTVLRTTTSVNVRSAASTSAPTLGTLASGTTVTVTGPSVVGGAYIWVPVSSPLGAGWIAGNYLDPVSTVTPTRTPAPPSTTSTPGGSSPTRTPSRTPTRPPGGFIAGDAVRTTANVNLRSAPTTSSTVLRVIPSKTEGTVTGPGVVSGSNTFYPVTIGGSTGYLAGSYLQRIGATATPSRTRTPTATVVGSTVRYTTNNVNLRKGPGTSYSIVATIPKGTRVNITGTPRRSGGIDWYPVIINGVGSGWMAGSLLTAIPPL